MREQEVWINGQREINDVGLYPKFTNAQGRIVDHEWKTAIANGESVGACRCGGDLIPNRPRIVSLHRTDYDADCSDCQTTVAAPFGKTTVQKMKDSH